MEIIENSKGEVIGSVDKQEGSKSGWFGMVLMPNASEDKEAFFHLKKDAIKYVKEEYKKANTKSKNMATPKRKTTAKKSTSGYKVSYSQILSGGKTRRETTVITYPTKVAAQKYADQLNQSPSRKNARVVKASSSNSKLNAATTKPKGIVKFTAKNAHVEGIKRDGTLKKGWKYPGGGKSPVKVKPVAKKPASKRGLGVTRGQCVRVNKDGSTTTYGESMTAGNPCPAGGRIKVNAITMQSVGVRPLAGAKTRKKPATAKQKSAQSKFAVNSRKARQLVKQGKAKNLKAAWKIIKKK